MRAHLRSLGTGTVQVKVRLIKSTAVVPFRGERDNRIFDSYSQEEQRIDADRKESCTHAVADADVARQVGVDEGAEDILWQLR